ncbi:hypothetical protein [Stenotrophomonas geniculata]|jgi:hypothetical protein|uniref:hypothetical protein n=1 Tax=Stenotrophomonas geniculata TaxID=86188 RepID=UPI002E774F82|nr:hypothetical protein [Stenotrophomonas geniculata]
MNELLAAIDSISLDEVMTADTSFLDEQRGAIRLWIGSVSQGEISKETRAAVLEAIKLFRAAVTCAKHKANAKRQIEQTEAVLKKLDARQGGKQRSSEELEDYNAVINRRAEFTDKYNCRDNEFKSAYKDVSNAIPSEWAHGSGMRA